ncbi:MAG: hypothetical protein CL928_15120 [Deltaproteobacteria bacterium]|nr:hypothetical protein [Deltaproteobacteria bacterium]
MPRKKKIHVNMHVIRRNRKEGTADPPITVKVGKENHYGSEVFICGSSSLKYSPHKPLLSCGARLILECNCQVVIDGEVIE